MACSFKYLLHAHASALLVYIEPWLRAYLCVPKK